MAKTVQELSKAIFKLTNYNQNVSISPSPPPAVRDFPLLSKAKGRADLHDVYKLLAFIFYGLYFGDHQGFIACKLFMSTF